jgi:hypothetical protein
MNAGTIWEAGLPYITHYTPEDNKATAGTFEMQDYKVIFISTLLQQNKYIETKKMILL